MEVALKRPGAQLHLEMLGLASVMDRAAQGGARVMHCVDTVVKLDIDNRFTTTIMKLLLF